MHLALCKIRLYDCIYIYTPQMATVQRPKSRSVSPGISFWAGTSLKTRSSLSSLRYCIFIPSILYILYILYILQSRQPLTLSLAIRASTGSIPAAHANLIHGT